MMKVTHSAQEDAYQEHQKNLSKLNNELKKKIASRENEIKEVEKHYGNKMAAVKKDQEIEYEKSIDKNQEKMLTTANQFEEKIQSYRDKLTQLQDSISAEEKYIKSGHRERMDGLSASLQEDLDSQKERVSGHYQEMQLKTKETVADINQKARDERTLTEQDNHEKMNAFNLEQHERLELNRQRQVALMKQNDVQHKQNLQEQEIEMKGQMAKELKNNLNMKNEMARVGEANVSFQDKYNQSRLLQLEEDFQVRYQNMSQKHQETLKTLEDNFNQDLQKVIQKNSQAKGTIAEKIHDPFYSISTLNPQIQETEKEVIVSLPIAQHEQNNVRLSTKNRLIKMTLARRFDDKLNAEDGSQNRSTRNELFSKEFSVKDILNPNGITQKYENGILSFKVLKA